VNKARRVFLLWVLFFVSYKAFGMELLEEKGDFLQSQYVRYEGSITREQIEPYIRKIENNYVGRRLLAKIDEKYRAAVDKCSGVIFKNGYKTAFSSRKNKGKIDLVIEIANFSDSNYPILYNTSNMNIVAVSSISTPFWITLAHELIHLKHKLEEISMGINSSIPVKINPATLIGDIPYFTAKTIDIDSVFLNRDYVFLYTQLPELSELRVNMSELWPNLEERRTVIGPDNDGISEASVRTAANMGTRYIYQKNTINLLENKTVLKSNFKTNEIRYVPYLWLMAKNMDKVDKFCEKRKNTILELTPIDILMVDCKITEEEILEHVQPGRLLQKVSIASLENKNPSAYFLKQNAGAYSSLLHKISTLKPLQQSFVIDWSNK